MATDTDADDYDDAPADDDPYWVDANYLEGPGGYDY